MPSYAFSYRALADFLKQSRPEEGVLLACIDGPGGSGKSTIANGLATASEDIQIVHLDDFYRPSADRHAGPIAERRVGADFDLGRLRAEVLRPLRGGQLAAYHVYDWTTDRVSARTVPLTKPIAVVEGVYSFSLELSEFFDFSVWVECPRDVRLARGIARDGEAARSRWEKDWMLGEEQYVERERPRDRVTLVCDGSQGDCRDGVVVLRDGGLRER